MYSILFYSLRAVFAEFLCILQSQFNCYTYGVL